MINILILNWKSAESIKNCIDAIMLSLEIDFRIVIINNYSTDLDYLKIKKIYSSFLNKIEIHLVANNENLGYAGGNNTGFNFLQSNNLLGDILILNSDIYISENTISEMKKALVTNIGIVTVRTRNSEGKILYDAIRLNGFVSKYIITDKKVIKTDYSQGSCMLINRDVINEIGLFDDRFFLYWEEVDFSLRVKEFGMEIISITATYVTRGKNDEMRLPLAFYYSIRNAKLILSKHKNTFSKYSYIFYLLYMFILAFKFIKSISLFNNIIVNYFLALKDSYKNRYYRKY